MDAAEGFVPGLVPGSAPVVTPHPVLPPGVAIDGHDTDATTQAVSPLDAWWRLQDLLWRLHALGAVEVVGDNGNPVAWVRFVDGETCPAEIQAVLDPEVDRWLDEGKPRHLVCSRELLPGGVVLGLAPSRCIQRWPDGPALLDEMTTFFFQLSRNIHERTLASA